MKKIARKLEEETLTSCGFGLAASECRCRYEYGKRKGGTAIRLQGGKAVRQ